MQTQQQDVNFVNNCITAKC